MTRTQRILLGALLTVVATMLALMPAIRHANEAYQQLDEPSSSVPTCASVVHDATGQAAPFCPK